MAVTAHSQSEPLTVRYSATLGTGLMLSASFARGSTAIAAEEVVVAACVGCIERAWMATEALSDFSSGGGCVMCVCVCV